MPQSLSQIYVQLVFSTKERARLISSAVQPELHAYLAAALTSEHCPAIIVGGMPDHVHILFRLGRTVTLSDAAKIAKVESSKWMKREHGVPDFAWQAGYGAFSVSASNVEDVTAYIREQERHHTTLTFQDEFRRLLERYHVEYNEAYVWD